MTMERANSVAGDKRRGRATLKRTARVAIGASQLVLLVGVICVWAWSYRTSMTADWCPAGRRDDIGVSWGYGLVSCHHIHVEPPAMQVVGVVWKLAPTSPSDRVAGEASWDSVFIHFRHGSFIYATMTFEGFSGRYLQLPFWSIALAASVLPAFSASRWIRRRRRTRSGRCLTCGYDLRASEGVCPECGTPIARRITPSHDAATEAHPRA